VRPERLGNARFVQADACDTGLPSNSFDLAYCRFLLLHLGNPAACLREMRRVPRPGGILVIEMEISLPRGSVPPTPLNAFADLFNNLGSVRGRTTRWPTVCASW